MTTHSGSTLVYSGTLVEAQRVWSALSGHGLDAWLLDQTVGNLYGQGGVLVVVRADQLERARKLLVELGLVTALAREG